VGVPDKQGRKEILQIHTRGMPLEPDYDKKSVLRVLNELKRKSSFEKAKLDEIIKKVEGAKDENEIKEILKDDGEIYKEVRHR
ncbi:hypothetical protein, partial [Thermococcus litoralis]|uniref:hypothetical protein n=1 Tax=Thermococcus litoralis TaxID=2265 RepID=UPI00117D75D0